MSFCTRDDQDVIVNQRVAEIALSVLPKKANTDHTLRLEQMLRGEANLALTEASIARPTEAQVRGIVNAAVTKTVARSHLTRIKRTKVDVRRSRPGRRAPAGVRNRVDEMAQFGQIPRDARRATI
ncbi:hypothetical protein IT414_04240 [bacterium]|nr:hypothetical protein [bacterium]